VNLLRRVIVENRVALAIIALAIAGNVAAYVFVVYPLQGRVSSGEARAMAATRAQRMAERDLVSARATQAGKQVAEVQLQKFYHEVLPDDLASARIAAYVRLAQLAAQSNLRYERHIAEKAPEKNSRLMRMGLTVVLDGSYQDVRRFIHAIETAPEFLVIDNMALMVRNEPNAPLVLTLAVSTYYWNGGNAS
jgi:Tfp pilus assembly protein PilO